MEEILDTVKKEISAIEQEVMREKTKRRRTLQPGDLKRKKERLGRIELILTFLSIYENDPRTTQEEIDKIWRYQGQLEIYLKFYQ